MNTCIAILLVLVGIIILVSFVISLMSVAVGKSKDVVSPAVNQNKSQDPNLTVYTVNPKPFPCIVCGNTTFLPNGECISCGQPEPR